MSGLTRLAALLLTACAIAVACAAVPLSAQPSSGVATRSERPHEDAADGALSAGKPVAAFAVEHRVTGTPMVGLPLELHLTLRPESSIEDVAVQISADSGLYVDAANARLEAASALRDSPAEWVVEVVPVEEGLFHVKVTAEGLIDGVRQARSLMVPIRVGAAKGGTAPPKAAAPPGAESAADPDAADDRDRQGERLIRLPAEEGR